MKTREKILLELKNLNRATKEVSIEHLRLFIADENQHRIAMGANPLECYVIDISALKNFLIHHLESDSPMNKRFQLIVHNGKHYLTIDILWGKHEKKCLLLDAANDIRMMPASIALADFPFDQIFAASSKIDNKGRSIGLQQDDSSCPIFALDHAFQLSKMDIYHKLKGENFHENLYTVYWEQLPIQLIWNAQSLRFLDRYLVKNNKFLTQCELEEYSEYLNKNKQSNSAGKVRNVAIDNIFDSLIKSAILFVEHLEENQIISILENHSYIPPIKIKEIVDSNISNSQSFFNPPTSVNMGSIGGIAALNLGKN